jgi:hypothetical protein
MLQNPTLRSVSAPPAASLASAPASPPASPRSSNDARLPPCYALAGVECGLLPFRYTFRVATFAGASKENPSWLLEASEFCRSAGIKIMAWGPDLLTFEAKSPDRAWEIATKLAQFGFKTTKNRISANA